MTDETFIQTQDFAVVLLNEARDDVMLVSMLGFLMSAQDSGAVFTPVTLRGPVPGAAVLGPEGDVTFNGTFFEDLETYLDWVKENMQ